MIFPATGAERLFESAGALVAENNATTEQISAQYLVSRKIKL
jgi:hypothetical protein